MRSQRRTRRYRCISLARRHSSSELHTSLHVVSVVAADGKDFTRVTLQLDFKEIKGISGVTGADLVPGLNKYQAFSILRCTDLRRASVMTLVTGCSRSSRLRLSESSNS